tara:strand:+ start:281 stop:1309 length:1029 start_codon:yes stop_codon:yes gene_type:complete
MKIIVLGPDYDLYQAASYQYEFMNTLKEYSNKYFHYSDSKEIDLETLCAKAKFVPNIIFYNHGWLHDNPNVKRITYTKLKDKLSNKNIKHVLFLNKEYTRLEEKINEINKYRFDLVFTHLHSFNKMNKTSVITKFLPLACSYKNLSNFNKSKLKERKYDLFFSGILQNWNFKDKQSDLRKKIQNNLFYCVYDFPLLKRFKYRNLNIYWKPFYKNRWKNMISNCLHSKRLNQSEYFKTLSDSKCVLHTASPLGIISTRVFEALGSGAIGLFSFDSQADVIFQNKVHYLSFESFQEFINNVYAIKNSDIDSEFQKIADMGRLLVESQHTWKNRVSFFNDEVLKL